MNEICLIVLTLKGFFKRVRTTSRVKSSCNVSSPGIAKRGSKVVFLVFLTSASLLCF